MVTQQQLKRSLRTIKAALRTQETLTRATHPAAAAFEPSMPAITFEKFCEGLLRQCGWDVQRTKATRDHGADLVATKGEHIVAIQCKRSASVVGVKAVQEIAAARPFFAASHAAVVTNSSYTSSAEQLAGPNNVLLLHFTELDSLDGRVAF